ncbi:hypothetical protein [Pseudorhodoferax sp. Leaf267]|uniref:hypothetical protein n=1 Tax=Pseudorhodoferax sp. Leaf267 TaxID=1736316 RepID=UPI000700DC89|nr:hypothetical protein [Pseudorhodoferax sp. Leaf267]KQP12777.1 hypothetical protein ASF43_21445 [Pseudorhodoferax sp. Leaf267]
MRGWLCMAGLATALAGCGERPAPAARNPAVAPVSQVKPAAPVAPATDAWLGRWLGPEGTFIDVQKATDGYTLTIRNLDGPLIFSGTPAGDRIAFQRDGKPQTLRATDGPGTGMKWLQEKKDCLVVEVGEGWCRD